jgi:hypothetical protein
MDRMDSSGHEAKRGSIGVHSQPVRRSFVSHSLFVRALEGGSIRGSILPIRGSSDDFGTDAVSGENLQKQRMRNPSIDQMNL